MHQLTFPSLNICPARARKTDPETSHRAADRAESMAVRDCAKIVRALEQGPGTIYTIGERCGLHPVAVARRLPEMEREEPPRAKPTGGTEIGPNGRWCRIWQAA